MGTTLFISYRRGDTAGWAGSLHRDLTSLMGPDATIFMDVDGIPPGEDFAKYIDQSVGQCDALIALIGPRWAGATSDGTRRIDNPDDFVRLEVASALQRGIRVIPIQVDDATLPARSELPDPLKPLRDRQAIEVDNTTWDAAITRLVASFDTTKPKLAVSPAQLDFGVVPVNAPWPRMTVQLRNEGGGELRSSASSGQSWIIVRNRGDALDILIDTSREGDYNGVVDVQSAGGRSAIPVTAVISSERSAKGTWTPPANPAPTPAAMPTRTPSAPQFSMPPQTPQAGPAEKMPSTYLVPAVVTTLLCCLPTGIVAIVYASRVSSLYTQGDLTGARSASNNAKTWSIVSVVLGVIAVLFFLASGFVETGSY